LASCYWLLAIDFFRVMYNSLYLLKNWGWFCHSEFSVPFDKSSGQVLLNEESEDNRSWGVPQIFHFAVPVLSLLKDSEWQNNIISPSIFERIQLFFTGSVIPEVFGLFKVYPENFYSVGQIANLPNLKCRVSVLFGQINNLSYYFGPCQFSQKLKANSQPPNLGFNCFLKKSLLHCHQSMKNQISKTLKHRQK
jgi:hypothetical protein